MPDLAAFFRSAPHEAYSGTVYRICPARFHGSLVSMRGAFLYGARYNIRGYFGAVYTSLRAATAQREMARYFTVPPVPGFVMASVALRLTRVVDFSDRRILRRARINPGQIVSADFTIPREIGLRAWESGVEALMVPSAAIPGDRNLVVFLDNQRPRWRVGLSRVEPA